MTNLTQQMSAPAFDPSANLWYRTVVYIDDNGQQYGNTLYVNAPYIDDLPDQNVSGYMTFAGLSASAIAGLEFGLFIGAGNPVVGAGGALVGLVSELSSGLRAVFLDSLAHAIDEAIGLFIYPDPGVDIIRIDGQSIVYTFPSDNDFNQYYSLKLGTAANDVLIATSEYIVADVGNDTIVGIDDASASIDGGEDIDTLSYTNLSQGIFIDMEAAQSALGELAPIKDVFDNIENIVGSEFNDTIHGDSNNNLLNGGGGDDIIIGGGGQDTIIGGAGVDTIQYIGGSSGTSTISGAETVKIGNDNISGDWHEGETEGEYRKGGVTATKDGDDLVIDAGGNQIRIDDFDEETNNYGVNLQEKDDDEPPSDDNTPSQIDEAADLFGRAQVNQFTDPLVLDLDGDGIELLNLDESNVYFDMTGDGYAEHVGWVAPDDGLLVRDINGNGVIDGIDELYGSATQTGFDELAEDEAANGVNSDRIINAADDPLFAQLQVWQDLDSDGLVDAGELSSLTDLGITSLDISSDSIADDNRWLAGNRVIEFSNFTKADGSTGELLEVLFRTESDLQVGGFGGLYTGNDAALLALPQSRGYGQLSSLQDAMDSNATLRSMVEAFAVQTDYGAVESDVIAILYEWAGVSTVSPTSRGSFMDAQKLAFLEAIFDTPFLSDGTEPNPTQAQADLLNEAWSSVFDFFKGRLAVQGPLADIFPNASYDFLTDELNLGDDFATILQRIEQQISIEAFTTLMDLREILLPHAAALQTTSSHINLEFAGLVKNALGSAEIEASLIAAFDAESVIDHTVYGYWEYGQRHEDIYQGGARDDLILGSSNSDILMGGQGVDLLLGGAGNDTLIASEFRDGFNQTGIVGSVGESLFGGAGDDVFFLRSNHQGEYDRLMLVSGGDGDDSFYGDRVHDSTLDGGAGDDDFTRVSGSNLVVNMGAGNDSYDRHSRSAEINTSIVDLGAGDDVFRNRYADANTIDGGEGDDLIAVHYGYSSIEGGAGNDTIDGINISYATVYGGDGDDYLGGSVSGAREANSESYLYGGTGDDTITFRGDYAHIIVEGGQGNDHYITSDDIVMEVVIRPTAGEVETITITDLMSNFADEFSLPNVYSATILNDNLKINLDAFTDLHSLADLTLQQQADDVVIVLPDDQQIILQNMTIETLRPSMFAGRLGSGVFEGTAGNDVIRGSDRLYARTGEDTIRGGEGDDLLDGLEGNDILLGGAGDDILYGGAGEDTLIGGAGNDILRGGTYAGYDEYAGTFFGNPDGAADHFVITSDAGSLDRIFAYEEGRDKIDLSQISSVQSLADLNPVYGYEYFVYEGYRVATLSFDQQQLKVYVNEEVTLTENDFVFSTVGQRIEGALTGQWVAQRITDADVGAYQLIDWDGDGQVDVLADDGVQLSLINGATGMVNVLGSYADYRIADMNADGQMDIVSTNLGGIGWYSGGHLTQYTRIAHHDVGQYEVGDFNNDGQLDVVSSLATYTSGVPVGGAVWFDGAQLGAMTRITYNDLGSFQLADIDANGQLDIIASGSHYQNGDYIGGMVTYTYNAAGISQLQRHSYIEDPHFKIAQLDADAQLEVITNGGLHTNGQQISGVMILEGGGQAHRFGYHNVGDYVPFDVNADGVFELIGTQGAYQNGAAITGVVAHALDGGFSRFGDSAYVNVDGLSLADWDGDGSADVIAHNGALYGTGLVYYVQEGANDTLAGGAADDTIAGSRGDDVLTGNAGADIFQFSRGMGDDIIIDFEAGADMLEFSNVLGITSAQDALNAIDYSGSNAVLHTFEGSITLNGVTSALTHADIIIV